MMSFGRGSCAWIDDQSADKKRTPSRLTKQVFGADSLI